MHTAPLPAAVTVPSAFTLPLMVIIHLAECSSWSSVFRGLCSLFVVVYLLHNCTVCTGRIFIQVYCEYLCLSRSLTSRDSRLTRSFYFGTDLACFSPFLISIFYCLCHVRRENDSLNFEIVSARFLRKFDNNLQFLRLKCEFYFGIVDL